MATKHTHQVVFGRKVDGCPRCAELLAGAAPVVWKGMDAESKKFRARQEAAQLYAIRHHDCKASHCGPVCTLGVNRMNTLTTDFSGTYDYPEEEAQELCRYYQSMIDAGYSIEELCQMAVRERKHWERAFGNDSQGHADMRRFVEVFNSDIGKKINFAM